MHRILRLICLLVAVIGLVVSAQTSRQLARMGLKEIEPIDDSVPKITQLLVVRVADGSFPVLTLAGALACLVAVVGLFVIFSTKVSPDASSTTLLVVCTMALLAAAILLAATTIALSIGRAPVL
jgi:uncharacterized membrane protein YjjP (DUF1212 family)